MARPPIEVAPEVREALDAGRPVVALETAVVTHGLPRTPLDYAHGEGEWPEWNARLPANLALALLTAAAVRQSGAVPATIGMVRGRVVVGLAGAALEALAAEPSPRKLSARDLGPAAEQGASGGTTVAGTLAICRALGIRVFATGGIGGVHRGWAACPDISADLHALATTPTAVVSAGAKAILDLPATVESLDTLGVPVLGVGTRWFPRFTSPGDDRLRVQVQVRDAAEAARVCAAHWSFNPATGVLVANPPPAAHAIPSGELESALAEVERAAVAQGVRGEQLTPFLLAGLAAATRHRSVHANIAVLAHNAVVGAQLAVALGA